ncbi:MAG: 50S ribosomal protein L6 [Cohaesibacteraceae bacterium]|nr:50S ribosomal protein L6 [Cohaesibacteraceae bacterium]
MSRIGKKPVAVPSGVTATIDGNSFSAKGPMGELSLAFTDNVTVSMSDDGVLVAPVEGAKNARSHWGMVRTMISNLFEGVSKGYVKQLEMKGVGYRAQMKGNDIQLALGLSHDVIYKAPDGIKLAVGKPTEITVSGIDKQRVGQTAADIRKFRPPEPYKGKGIRYVGEFVFRKEGKKK